MDDHSVNSSSSSRGKASPANKDQITLPPQEEEESGWTSYFEDFSKTIEEEEEEEEEASTLYGGSSLLSDAASSYAAWKKFSHNNNNHIANSSPNLPKKLCFKKAIRSKQISEDDPLEDTASSPVNSPKVGDLNSTKTVSSKIDGQLDGSMGQRSFLQTDGDDDDNEDKLNFKGKSNNIDCNDLKNRGLCLVPLSMLVNYLG